MRKLASLTAAAALVALFGFAGTASADEFADVVESFIDTGSNGSNPGDATGATDTDFAVLGDGGILILKFTDNTCLNEAGPDVTIVDDDDGTDEDYNVSVGLESQTLTSIGVQTETTPTTVDTGTSFTRIGLIDQDQQIGAGGSPGAEIDSVACINNLDFGTDHIDKINDGDTDITIQAKGATSNGQQFFVFRITIENPEDEDLSGLIFEDVLPAEFDLDPDAEETADGGGCPTDGDCDGVMVSGGSNPELCTAEGEEHTNQGKSNKTFNLQPDIITITADLGDDQDCEITVWAATDQKATGSKKVNFTPTECNETTFIFLNEGVKVFDDNGTPGDPSDDILLFIDDDTIELSCTNPTFP